MQQVLELVTSTYFGRAAHKAVSPLVHLFRRISNPNIPNDHTITKVAYRGHTFNLEHRRWSASDVLAIEQCFTQAQYDMPSGAHGVLIENLYREIVASGLQPLIIDCGANIGASITWLSARYPEAHIIGVEPSAENFYLLERNCAGLNVDLRLAGISSADGRAYLYNPSGTHMDFRTTSENRGVEIDLVSVGSLLASKPASAYAPFLLKIDIEGAEKNLFDGETESINRFPLIILEPHDWLMPGQQTSQEFFRFHAASGREFCMKHENIASIVPHSSLLKMTTGLKN
jgi:FkbM family methyltransferase